MASQEFPKAMYRGKEVKTANNQQEQDAAAKDGFKDKPDKGIPGISQHGAPLSHSGAAVRDEPGAGQAHFDDDRAPNFRESTDPTDKPIKRFDVPVDRKYPQTLSRGNERRVVQNASEANIALQDGYQYPDSPVAPAPQTASQPAPKK